MKDNMAGLFGGAALGPPFQMLFEIVVKIPLEKALLFKGMLIKIRTTVEAMNPLIKQLAASNMALDRPQSEMQGFIVKLEEGKELVGKCYKYSTWRYIHKRPSYTTKLQKLDEDLDRLLKILPVQQARDQAETLILVRELHANSIRRTEVSNNDLVNKQIEINGCCQALEPPAFIVGLDEPLEELKMKLLRDESTVPIVVTAPPGCGKTTLAKKLCKDAKIIEKFKSNILFVTVSKNPDLNLIVQDLYQHKDYSVPPVKDNKDAVVKLELFLKEIGEEPIFLVLDDVWSGSESFIDNFVFQIPEYKILVTSRFPISRFGSPYKLKSLRDEEAMAIFQHYAFLEDGRSDIPNELVKKVVQCCKRFPLALKLIGSSLRGEDPHIWVGELDKWSRDSVLDSEAELLRCLQRSLDVLGEQDAILKECFMDLGSFPEDQRVPATALIDIWTELHEPEKDATYNLFKLNKWNLANVVVTRKDMYEVDDYYSEHFVTQHDMLRELAIHQSRQVTEQQRKRLIVEIIGNNLPKWWKEHNDQPFDARLLAISTDGSFSSEWCDIKLPEAKVLVLNLQTKTHRLPKFVKNMNKLKVLIITNFAFFQAELNDFQLLESLTNLRRIRLERIVLKETPPVLKKLQKLSLFMCELGQAFNSIKLSEVFPNLVEINIDYCNDLVELPAGICELFNLEKLSITHCHNLSTLPQEIGNLVNLKVLRLRFCIDLEELPDSTSKLSKLTLLDISDCFSIRNLPENIGQLCSLTKLNMKNCSRLLELPPSVLDFKQLKDVVCDEELKELWEFYLPADDSDIKLRLAKDEVNLNWLENHHS